MIGDETAGVGRTLELRGQGLKVCEIDFVIGIGEEAAAIVAALKDADQHLGDGDPRTGGKVAPGAAIAEKRKPAR